MAAGKIKAIEKSQPSPESCPAPVSRRDSAQSPNLLAHPASPQLAGNQAIQQLLRTGAIQAKLSLSQPTDPDEREADSTSRQVMFSKPASMTRRSCAACAGGTICPECEGSQRIQPKEKPGHTTAVAGAAAASQIATLGRGGQPLSPSLRSFFEPRFGQSFGHVRVHTGEHASALAEAIQARAFTLGNHIVFGSRSYEPESSNGQRLLAHELAHVVQQGRGAAQAGATGEWRVQRDTEVSTSSGSGSVPLLDNTAYDWVRRHGAQLVRELTTELARAPLNLPLPEMRWHAGQEGFVRSLMAPLAGDSERAWTLLPSYLRPDSLVDAVNIGRDCYPSPLGSSLWRQGVVNEVTRRLSLRLIDSLGRVARRAARHLAREWSPLGVAGGAFITSPSLLTRTALNPASASNVLISFLPGALPTGLAFSHPIDPFVYSALREGTELDVASYRIAHPEDFSAQTIATDERPLREVRFEFLASRGLPSWIRVTTPPDATVEEVANTLYGDPTAAHRLTAVPPMFGLPAQDMPTDLFRPPTPSVITVDRFGRTLPPEQAEARSSLLFEHQIALLEAMRQAGIDTREMRRGDGAEREILASPMADEAALRAAGRIMPTPGVNKELVRERMAMIYNKLAAMEAPAGELARPPDAPTETITIHTDSRQVTREPFLPPETRNIRARVVQARDRVRARFFHLTDATDAEAIAWDGQTRGQLEIVSTALNGILAAAAKNFQYRGWPNIYNLISNISEAYVEAAEISDIYPAARARLDVAEQRSQLFPATVLELFLARIREMLAEARTSEMTAVTVHPETEYGVSEMDRQGQELRDRLAQLRTQILQNPREAEITLNAIRRDMQSLQTGASLALNLDTVDRVWQALYDSLSFMGEVRAFFGGGNENLSKGMRAANRIRGEWQDILWQWRRGERDEARAALQSKAQGPWRIWVNDMTALIREHQQWDRLMTFAAMIGIAVLSGGIGSFVEGAVGTAWGVGAGASAWAELGAAGIGVLTEASAFTLMSYPMTATHPSLGDFGSQLGQNVLFFGGGRVLARGFQGLLGEARAATAAGRLATTGVVTTGFIGVNLLMANAQAQRQRGRGLTGNEAAEISLENAAFIGLTALVSAIFRRQLTNLRLSGELTGLNFRHTRALRLLDVTMREVSLAPEPNAALRQRLITDTERALGSEQALADRMRAIVERADARVDERRPNSERARDRELARFGITAEVAGQLRSGALNSQVLTGLRVMQGVRISRALEPIGNDFAINARQYQEALSYFRSLPDTTVVEAGPLQVELAINPADLQIDSNGRLRLNPSEPVGPRLEPGGESFLVQPAGEAPFRVYKRAPGAVGEVAGRVELAPSAEAAASERDPMARPVEPSGGRAGASETDWGLPAEAIEGTRRQLMARADLGAVASSMSDAGLTVSQDTLRAVKRYLFESSGIGFDRANFEAWQRLVSGRAEVRDIAFLVHEMAEIRALEQVRRQTGFDYRGTNFERMDANQRRQWRADFSAHYLEAHSQALAVEYAYVAEAVAQATSGRIRIGRNIAASVDPARGEARANMMVDGLPLSQHRDFPTWQARGAEIVEIGAGTQERLRLQTRTPTLAELVGTIKRAPGGPEAATARTSRSVSWLAPGVPGGGSRGRTGAEAGDQRVDPFLDSLRQPMAARFRDSGHAAALREAPSVVDFLTRTGERNVAAFESFIVESRLPPGEAIPILNDLLAAHPTMTSTQLAGWARAVRGNWAVPARDTSSIAARLRACVLISRQPRYAGNLERAVTDLRSLLADNVELPVALNELVRPSDFGEPATAPVAGPGGRGPDLRLTFAGSTETVGREMYATDLATPSSASPEDVSEALHSSLMRGIREKAIDYLRPDVPQFTHREIAVHVRRSSGGYNFDLILTQTFLDDVMLHVRVDQDTVRAGAQNVLQRVVFYNSRGDVAYIWTR